MKPFDLESALAGALVVTRDGREVTQLVKFCADDDRLLFGVLSGTVVRWNANGMYFSNKSDAFDLFMAPQKKKLWIQVMTTTQDTRLGGVHATTNATGVRPSTTRVGYQLVEVEIDV